MDRSFNLVDQPFVPCSLLDGQLTEMGLRDILVRAHEVAEIRDDSPLVTIALHRLLLALLHRNFGPASLDAWSKLWQAGRFDPQVLESYLEQWRDRFDLCDPKHPFYQWPVMEESKPVPVTRLALVAANNATLFDHRYEAQELPLPPNQTAQLLIAYQAFAVGGGVSKPFNLCHSPLISQGGYLILIVGENLFQTLCLNLLVSTSSTPIPSSASDTPIWERSTLPAPDEKRTVPLGYLDYLTWQSRRVRLLPHEGDQLRFDRMHMLQGMRLTDSFGSSEPMAVYVRNQKDEYRARGFDESRGLWRDSHVLLSGADYQKAPLGVQQVEQLKRRGLLDRKTTFRLAAFGLSTDQAKVHFWRHETMPLPLAYLGDKALLDDLRDALEATEDAGKAVYESIRNLAEIVSTGSQGRPDQDRAKQLAAALYQQGRFWARLEEPFRRLLQELPTGDDDARLKTLEQWRAKVCGIARETFNDLLDGLDLSPRILKGIYSDQWGAQKTLNVALHKILQIGKEPANA